MSDRSTKFQTDPFSNTPATQAKQIELIDDLTALTHDNIHTAHKELRVYSEGHVCSDNTTTTPLGVNEIFTGNWQDTLDYSEIIVSVYASVPSITDGLLIEWSSNAIDVHGDDTFTISATSGKTFSFPCQNRYVRVTYKNDGVAQTKFSLETLLKRFASKGSSHRLKDSLVQEDDAIVTKTLIAGFSTAGGGSLVNVKVNPSGSVQVGGTIDQVSNAKPFLIDEFGVESQMLSDNMFAESPVTVEAEHHEIHCGDSFLVSRVVDLANGSSDVLIISVPNETGNPMKEYHTVINVSSESEVQYDLYEGVSTVANGTTITSYNRNRNSNLTSGLLFFHTPTTPTGGTVIETKHWGSGRQSGGETRGQNEIILKNNTKYMIVLNNQTTTANHVSWEINHYIHPGI